MGWLGIKRVIKVIRWDSHPNAQSKPPRNKPKRGKRKARKEKQRKVPQGTHFYILSRRINEAKRIGSMIRMHWGIENHLHWPKDAYFKEDNMSVKDPKGAAVIALLNSIAINQVRKAGRKPSKDLFSFLVNNVKELFNIIST